MISGAIGRMTGKVTKMKTNYLLAFLMMRAGIPLSFNSGAQPAWKMDGDKVALKDGNPVYLDASGAEMVIEFSTIARLNAEAKTHREAKEAAEKKLKDFEGVDAVKAREALETVSKLDTKKLIDAGEVDRVRREIGEQYTKQISERDKENGTLKNRLNDMILEGAFSGSKFLNDNIAVPLSMVRAEFGKFFKVENDKIVAIGRDGNPFYSPSRAGEPATFDEAIEHHVMTYPDKDKIIRMNTGGGTGSTGGGGGRGNARTMRRADFDKLNGMQQAETAAAVRKGEMQLID